MSLSTSPRSYPFRQPSSPLRLESALEGHEPEDEQVPGSKLTTNLDVQSDSGPHFNLRPSLHRTSKPLPSILKRKAPTAEEQEDIDKSANRFEISVVRYRTSCCESVVSLEHISDWIHETPSDIHRCPSCMLPCILNALYITPIPSQSQSLLPASVSLGRESARVLSLAHTLFQQQWAKIKLVLSPLPAKCQFDMTYKLLDTDDETYPENEFMCVLSTSLFATNIKETSVRLLSITGLTLVLLTLFSQ